MDRGEAAAAAAAAPAVEVPISAPAFTISPKLARQRSREIDRAIKKQAKKLRKQIKLLLLGTGESGKSTLVKQMKIIHGDGFSDAEKQDYREVIHSNIIKAMETLYNGLAELGISIKSPELAQEAANWFDGLNPTVTMAPIPLFERLWADPAIQTIFAQRNLLQLSDGAAHYMQSLARFADPKYVPTDLDVLHARLPTRGVHEFCFATKWGEFSMIDVGGQKSERRKWMVAFADVAAIIFVVASSDFDQTSAGSESGGNRLRESLMLFRHMMKGKHLHGKPVILFFNKSDLLQAKLEQGRSVHEHFPEFLGPEGDIAVVQKWLDETFKAQCPGEVYSHCTTAIDTANVKHVFEDVQDILVHEQMKRLNVE
mmetsp:Transcript_7194/g.18464  ORF Transcript_7194/g.18464 Transcript_7194/m.18464 type:complete len:370 (+) Transcript_7194:292-1401(+)